jgi:TatA/E family protein of Tat protein translocase
MPQIGPAEILVILLVGLLVFGPKKLPEIGRQVGRGLHELRKFQDTVKGEIDGVLHYDDDQPSPPAVNGAASNGANGSAPISAADAPPALPPAEADEAAPATKAGSRPPSRFRAPGSQPTT